MYRPQDQQQKKFWIHNCLKYLENGSLQRKSFRFVGAESLEYTQEWRNSFRGFFKTSTEGEPDMFQQYILEIRITCLLFDYCIYIYVYSMRAADTM